MTSASRRSAPMTRCPRDCNSCRVAAPIPDADPVITYVRCGFGISHSVLAVPGLFRRRGEPGIAGSVGVSVIGVEVDVQTLDQSVSHLEDIAEPATERFGGTPGCSIGEHTVGEAF